jgi:hypothetical protein
MKSEWIKSMCQCATQTRQEEKQIKEQIDEEKTQ